MFHVIKKVLDNLDIKWKQKVIGITTDGAPNMVGVYSGLVSRIQNQVDKCGLYRVWCPLHQLDIIIFKSVNKFFDDNFFKELTVIISHLRRQSTLIKQMNTIFPKVCCTLWMILGKVCRWFCNNRIPIQDYFNDNN